jgi:hypothetical protein
MFGRWMGLDMAFRVNTGQDRMFQKYGRGYYVLYRSMSEVHIL